MHELTDITLVILAALLGGLLFQRLRQPALVGYILAGVILGPSILGLIEEREIVSLLAELGVLMLLFLIGLELSLRAFRMVWLVASAFVAIHLLCTFGVVYLVSWVFGWSWTVAFLVSCSLSLSSTGVAIKILEDIHELRTDVGRITVGILIAQDLAVIPILLFLKNINTSHFGAGVILKIIASVAILGGVIWFLSRREKIHLPFKHLIQENAELLSFLGLACCFGTASLSGILGLSPAYGAFLGGLILGNTGMRTQLVNATQPIQLLLLMVFFLSIGLLLDLQFIWQHLGKICLFLLLLTVGKSTLNIGLLHALRYPWSSAFLSGLALGQMGEFSFLLANMGLQIELLTSDEAKLIISLTVLSLVISPLWLSLARRIEQHTGLHFQSLREMLYSVYDDEISTLLPKVERWRLFYFKFKAYWQNRKH